MDDRYEDLESIFQDKINVIKQCTFQQLIDLCDKENIDCDGMNEEELREALINYYMEEIEE